MMRETDPILQPIEQYLARSGLSASAFGRLAVGDPRFVFDLREGRECRRATRDRVRAWLRRFPPRTG
ncbi:MAG TPA: hypothetical protein VEB20_21100 [Azospirillaceae bacterium]|nr:hypothetical protein [Azospirillaceae bacterium]